MGILHLTRRDNRGRVLSTCDITPRWNNQVHYLRHLTEKERRTGINGHCPPGCTATHQYWVGTHWYLGEGRNKYYIMQFCPLHECSHALSIAYDTVKKVEELFTKYHG